jgi:hypothetical protein
MEKVEKIGENQKQGRCTDLVENDRKTNRVECLKLNKLERKGMNTA